MIRIKPNTIKFPLYRKFNINKLNFNKNSKTICQFFDQELKQINSKIKNFYSDFKKENLLDKNLRIYIIGVIVTFAMTIITEIIKFEYPRKEILKDEKKTFLITILLEASILGLAWPGYLLTSIIFSLKKKNNIK
jgi:hypothetical protein